MSTAKITIAMERQLVEKIDELVKKRIFGNRSQAIQSAMREKIGRMEHSRLARECSKLDIPVEQELADEGLSMEWDEWPEY